MIKEKLKKINFNFLQLYNRYNVTDIMWIYDRYR